VISLAGLLLLLLVVAVVAALALLDWARGTGDTDPRDRRKP
jgi:hypothetical protein